MDNIKIISQNRKAYHDYNIVGKIEVGIVLVGTEVKSLREGKVNFKDSYAKIKDGEVFLLNMHISPYKQGTFYNHDPLRPRKLLLKKNEIRKLTVKVDERGMTLIPLKIYFKQGKAKIELGLARGKKLYDKRKDMKEEEAKREMERAIK